MAKLKAGWIEVRGPLKDGMYRALLRYRDPLNGEKLIYGAALYADTKAEAEAAAVELQPSLADHLATRRRAKRDPEQMALEDWALGDWRAKYWPKLPPSTRANVDQWWSKWLGPLVGSAPLSQITPAFVDGLVGHMQELGARWPTIEQAVKFLRNFIRDATAEGLLSENALKEHSLTPPDLTTEELEELAEPEFALELEHAIRIAWCLNDLEDTAMAEAMAVAGLRLGEARALRFNNVLHPDGRPRARFQVRIAVSGRGSEREARGTKKTRGKSKQAIQRGFRTPQLVPSLGRLFERIWVERDRPPLDEWLAPGDTKMGVLNDSNWRRREFYPAVERAEVQQFYPSKRIMPKELRASAAAAYGHAQEQELSARAQLGHSSESVTLTFYFSAYEDPDPELRGKSIEWQLQRARLLTLEWMETQLEGLVGTRATVGKQGLLTWHRHGTVYTANSLNGSRYTLAKDERGWRVILGERKSEDLTSGHTIIGGSGLGTLAEAKGRAERQALKRTRQSLTIQRQRIDSQVVHLRALVAAAESSAQAA